MAGLSKEDRIQTSTKLVGIEDEIKNAQTGIKSSQNQKEEEESKDSPNRKFLDARTQLINPYQNELKLLDGTTRTELTEAILLDSAKKVLNNSFFPNDPQTPLPSLASGVWINPIPYSKTHAIGKDNFEVYTATGGRTESNIISDINAKIALIEAESIPNRATGQECIPGGSCVGETPPGSGVDETTCLANGGTWTPGPDTYAPYATIQTLLTDLTTLVQEWENRLNDEKAEIPTDSNSTRKTGNDNAISDIDNAVSVIDTWQGVQDFDTTTILPTGTDGSGCALFDALLEGDFEQAKLQPTTLQTLKDELTARSSYISTRISELSGNNYLGSINQDLSSGSIIDTQGLYGERFRLIDLRINSFSGSLTKVVSFDTIQNVQGQIKEGAENAGAALDLVMAATKATAPGIDTKYLNFKDLSKFSVGDRVYLVADKQEELSGSIEEIDGNRAKLTFNIPKKYTTSNNTRLYKLL